MKRRITTALAAALLGVFVAVLQAAIQPAVLIAHGGGLDSQGCHNDRQRGGYHCHRGPLAGESFGSAAAAAEAMRSRSAAPAPKAPPATTAASVQPLSVVGAQPSASSQISGVFESFDRQSRILTLKDAIGTTFQFSVRDDTTVAVGERADDYFETNAAALPWKAGQSLVIAWRPSADRQKRVAVSIR